MQRVSWWGQNCGKAPWKFSRLLRLFTLLIVVLRHVKLRITYSSRKRPSHSSLPVILVAFGTHLFRPQPHPSLTRSSSPAFILVAWTKTAGAMSTSPVLTQDWSKSSSSCRNTDGCSCVLSINTSKLAFVLTVGRHQSTKTKFSTWWSRTHASCQTLPQRSKLSTAVRLRLSYHMHTQSGSRRKWVARKMLYPTNPTTG